jgi:hypothetical protein
MKKKGGPVNLAGAKKFTMKQKKIIRLLEEAKGGLETIFRITQIPGQVTTVEKDEFVLPCVIEAISHLSIGTKVSVDVVLGLLTGKEGQWARQGLG